VLELEAFLEWFLELFPPAFLSFLWLLQSKIMMKARPTTARGMTIAGIGTDFEDD